MNQRVFGVGFLLFCSGLCALVYQTVWLREFRLVFGASTAATAAVLGIFMGGLGIGSIFLGRLAEKSKVPLKFYSNLEFAISIAAAASPFLVDLARWVYSALGGSVALGATLSTVVRLILSAIVLAAPTLLMGGTLPAAARSATSASDAGRHGLAWLYGANTLGAVTGVVIATFIALEALGNRQTLWAACALNALLAVAARKMAAAAIPVEDAEGSPEETAAPGCSSPRFVFAASAIVGFAFLLMELVWYRMLSPLLGGSTFTFGLILAVALFGIGIGGLLYSLAGLRTGGTLPVFAWTCALEALFIAIPFAIGDRMAVLAAHLRSLSAVGFGAQVFGWALIVCVVVLPASIVSGFQFPLMVSLLGRGGNKIGRHVANAYAWNTLGAIAGSLAGGFGLLPILTAPGAWQFVVFTLSALALAALTMKPRAPLFSNLGVFAMGSASAALMIFTLGPTAVWRHSGVGVGRSGLIGAALHGDVRRACVIGLGTGCTAGWLGKLPELERVDVMELEPAILKVARVCELANQHVLDNPKCHLMLGDAREMLLTGREKYDLIFSEPSNPYRAGIASLFTTEFYQAARARLKQHGLFLQWVQAYEVDGEAIRMVVSTMGDVFSHVEMWITQMGDLLLVASAEPRTWDLPALRARLAQEPFRTATQRVWGIDSAEGMLAHFACSPVMAQRLVAIPDQPRNTDDNMRLEFAFARSVGHSGGFNTLDLLPLARELGADRLTLTGEPDWGRVAEERLSMLAYDHVRMVTPPNAGESTKVRCEIRSLVAEGSFAAASKLLLAKKPEPLNTNDTRTFARVLSECGAPEAEPFIEKVRAWSPGEADALTSILKFRQGDRPAATASLLAAFHAFRNDAWPSTEVLQRALEFTMELADVSPEAVSQLFAALDAGPFSGYLMESGRRAILRRLSTCLWKQGQKTTGFAYYDAWPDWTREFLFSRYEFSRTTGMGDAMRDRNQLAAFLAAEPQPFARDIRLSPKAAASSPVGAH